MKYFILTIFISFLPLSIQAMPERPLDYPPQSAPPHGNPSEPNNQPKNPNNLFSQDNINIQLEAVDYTKKTMVFYKNDCKNVPSSCHRQGPVLTNIKSVIFDYAHQRGIFAKNGTSKKRNLSSTP